MATLNSYSMLASDLQCFANSVKDAIALQLNMPDLDNFLVVVGEPSIWGRFKNKIIGDKQNVNDLRILVVTVPPTVDQGTK